MLYELAVSFFLSVTLRSPFSNTMSGAPIVAAALVISDSCSLDMLKFTSHGGISIAFDTVVTTLGSEYQYLSELFDSPLMMTKSS